MRGFSLFTPLVGTALVLITLVITANIVGEMTSRHRSLLSQMDVSSNLNTIHIAKATIDQVIVENLKEEAKHFICETDLSDDEIENNLKEMAKSEAFGGMQSALEEAGFEQVVVNCPCAENIPQIPSTCASYVLKDVPDVADVDVSGNYVSITLYGNLIEQKAKECPFLIGFEDPVTNTQVSLIAAPSEMHMEFNINCP